MFSDCHLHTVWNHTSETRVIVAFDVLQSQYDRQRTWRCAQYLAALTLRSLDAYVPFRNKISSNGLRVLHNFISLLWWLYLPLQKMAAQILL